MTTSVEIEEIYFTKNNSEDTPKPGTSKNASDKSATDSDLSEDDFEIDDEFPEKSVRIPYTYQEDKEILEFLLQKENIFKVYSISLWKYFEKKKKKPKRTYQSLKNRFLRNIKPNIFKAFSHLINNEDEVEKILIKFPELKGELKDQKTTQRKDLPLTEKTFQNIIFGKSANKRTLKMNKNNIIVTVNLENSQNSSIPFLGEISKRFEKIKKRNKKELCSACGRLYHRPKEDNDIPNSHSLETHKNSEKKNINISNESNRRHMTVRSRCNTESSGSKNSLSALDKSDGNSEELAEDDIEESIEFSEAPMKKRREKDKSTDDSDSDSDIEIIYEQSVKRFPKLIDTEKEKTLERKFLNKHIDFIGFDADMEKSWDSFFLETETPLEISTSTPLVEVNSMRTQSPTSSSACF